GVASEVEAAGAFRHVDEEGVTHITDTPNDPRFRRISGFSGTASGWLKLPQAVAGSPVFSQEIRATGGCHGVNSALVEAVIRVEPPYTETRQYVQKVMERSGSAQPAVKAEPIQLIYRWEDADGTLTFSNVPPTTRVKDGR